MNDLPPIECPACKKITLPQIDFGDAVACPDCQTIFDKDYKEIGKFKNDRAIYNSVENIPIPPPLGKTYILDNIITGEEKTFFSIENAETGKILKAGDILPKFLMIKISL